MAGELQIGSSATALTVYAQIISPTGTIWSTAGASFGAYATASIGDYDVALTEQGTASKLYLGDFPAGITTPGRYLVRYLSRAGGSPAESDTVLGTDTISWTGTALAGSGNALLSTAGVTATAAGVWNALTASYATVNTFGAAVGNGATAANVWAYPTREITGTVSLDLTQALDATPVSSSVGDALWNAQSKLDATITSISGYATSAALSTAQTDLTTLVGRLTSARAGYLDSLSSGLYLPADIATAVWNKDISGVVTANYAGTVLNARSSASALSTAQTDLTTLTGRLTSTRAGYLDNLSAAAPTAATVATAVWDKDVSGYSTAAQAGTLQKDSLTATGVWAAGTRSLTAAVTVDLTQAVGSSQTAGTVGKSLRLTIDNLTAAPLAAAGTAAAVWGALTASYSGAGTFGLAAASSPTAAAVADAVWDEATSGHATAGTFGAANADTTTVQIAAFQLAGVTLTSAGRNAVATSLLDLTDGIESGVTLREAVRYIGATTVAVASGAGGATNTFKALGNAGTTRVVSTVTSTGNRTAVTLS